ncbi:hypothetical protein J2X98_003141 [Pseudarthrobacter enclensis]|uniref:Uncharacterized protein n=1 Tax=Pseudarthrobacter enclensis TaxID=993070 RepID=A0ABT9RWC1_9MICC|nr:hypothetical protein [Pseudarthrobacter enclensis]
MATFKDGLPLLTGQKKILAHAPVNRLSRYWRLPRRPTVRVGFTTAAGRSPIILVASLSGDAIQLELVLTSPNTFGPEDFITRPSNLLGARAAARLAMEVAAA